MKLAKHAMVFRIGRTLLTLFWGSWILLGTLLRVIRYPRKFMYAKEYTELPECAKKKCYGNKGVLSIRSPEPGGESLRISYMAVGDKSCPLMLLLHGFPECWYSWRYQLEEFSKDYYVVAVDTRGYGDSDKPRGIENYALSVLVDDVASIIKELGYEKATVVGHDWGGAMTWGFASRYPDMCEKVIILNCPHFNAQMKAFLSNIPQLLASWYMFYFLLPYLPELVMKANDFSMLAATFIGKKGGVKNRQNFTSEDLDVFKHSLRTWEAREASHNYIRANLTYKSEFPRGKIIPRMLLIWGTGDLFLTKKMAEMSLSYACDIALKYIEGASHWVQQDCPDKVNELMRDFLRSQ